MGPLPRETNKRRRNVFEVVYNDVDSDRGRMHLDASCDADGEGGSPVVSEFE